MWAKARINALKNLQVKITDVESKLFKDIQDLERKYAQTYAPLFDERIKIITGQKEKLSDEEKEWKYVEDCVYKEVIEGDNTSDEDKKKIPQFWLTALKSTKMLSDMIQEHDDEVLDHLTDIRTNVHANPYSYTIEFHFSENEWFTNKVLTKTFELISEKDEKRPFMMARGNFYKSLGCKIDWKDGKDLTVCVTKTKQSNKKTGESRVTTKEDKQDSFFNFFNTHSADGIKPSIKRMLDEAKGVEKKETKTPNEDEDENMDHDLDALYEMDFEISSFLKETFIPKAILYYTGDLIDDDEEDDFFDSDEGEDEDGDDDDDDVAPSPLLVASPASSSAAVASSTKVQN